MSDIVERLRSHDDCLLQPIRRDVKEAADEIERLRAEIERLTRERNEARAEVERLHKALHKIAGKVPFAHDPWTIARKALEAKP